MSALDSLLLLAGIGLGLWIGLSRRWPGQGLLVGWALLVLGALLQFGLEGFYWQFLPLYAVLAWAGVQLLRPRRGRNFGLAGASLLALAPWVLLPVPQLPALHGPYRVGTEVFRWVDPNRPESATATPDDRRNLVVQAWYPAAAGQTGTSAPYIDGVERLPGWVSFLPGWAMARFDRIDSHGRLGVALSADLRQWPVVIFSPGYGAPRAFYTALVSDLASRGFVVLAIDHPYEAAVTELADGRLATPIEHFLPNDPDLLAYMDQHLALRAADLGFVLDQLQRPAVWGPRLAGRLDLQRVAAIGHSFGGASAVAVAVADARITAAANIDGTLYGGLADQPLYRPFLLLESDHGETGHSAQYLQDNQRLGETLKAPGARYQLLRANHFSFTDAPLFFSRPARWALAQLIGGTRGTARTLAASNDLLTTFLQQAWGKGPADTQAVAMRYGDIRGGPITRQGR
ncbi:MAG: hypothetical protein ABWY06_23515 [Pseudomonas sp.]|uniref:alpha/beta hydrolase family protein n=1 Tax=Pseudomonas sp. TaxID=306 RepID=UPI003390EB7E